MDGDEFDVRKLLAVAVRKSERERVVPGVLAVRVSSFKVDIWESIPSEKVGRATVPAREILKCRSFVCDISGSSFSHVT